ncbi:MAG: hypothetical protein JKX70_08290 [Phycisphaerales bacterium]|nr:hypothetical protein [Phycisphaerales bacterium]
MNNPLRAALLWCPNTRFNVTWEFKDSHEVTVYAEFASLPMPPELNVPTTPALCSHDQLPLKRIVFFAPILNDQNRHDRM